MQSHHAEALEEYLHAYRLQPDEPLVLLSIACTYISQVRRSFQLPGASQLPGGFQLPAVSKCVPKCRALCEACSPTRAPRRRVDHGRWSPWRVDAPIEWCGRALRGVRSMVVHGSYQRSRTAAVPLRRPGQGTNRSVWA